MPDRGGPIAVPASALAGVSAGIDIPSHIGPEDLLRDFARASDATYKLIAARRISGYAPANYVRLLEARKRTAVYTGRIKGVAAIGALAGLAWLGSYVPRR